MMFVGRDLGEGTISEYCIDTTNLSPNAPVRPTAPQFIGA
jgi:hypothetical protein